MATPSNPALEQLEAHLREISVRASAVIAAARSSMPAVASAVREITRAHTALADFRCSDTTGLHENVTGLELAIEQRLEVLNRILTEAHAGLTKLPVAAREYDAGVAPFLEAIGKEPSGT